MNAKSPSCVVVIVVSAVLGLAGCGSRAAPSSSAPFSFPDVGTRPGAESGPIAFREQELPFSYERGETGAAWPVETTGGGVGLLDYDGDGRLDLFFAQGGPAPAATAQSARRAGRRPAAEPGRRPVRGRLGLGRADAPGIRPGRGRGRLRRRRRPRRLRDPVRPQYPLAQRPRPVHRRHGRGRGRLRPLEPGRGLRRLRRRRRSRPVRRATTSRSTRPRPRSTATRRPGRPTTACRRTSRASPTSSIATTGAGGSPT